MRNVPKELWYRRVPWPVWMGAGLTSVWLVAIALYLAAYGKKAFWDLDLNEAGDFFAGAAAPLAFLWLFVAVLLQMIELGLQREELRQSREALQASAAEQKALVEQTRESAATARAALEIQQREVAEERLHKLLDTVAKRISRLSVGAQIDPVGSQLIEPYGLTLFAGADRKSDADDILAQAEVSAQRFCRSFREAMNPRHRISTSVNPDELGRLVDHLESVIAEARERDYPVMRVRIEQNRVGMLVAHIAEAMQLIGNLRVEQAMGRLPL